MKTKSKTLDIQRLHEEAEKNAAPEPRFVRQLNDWQNVRQGDLLLIRVPAGLLHAEKPAKSNQLAPGTTQGSRHTAEAPAQVFAPDARNAEILSKHGYGFGGVCPAELVGPVVKSEERFTVAHPEHAHASMPAGECVVLHQRDYEQEEISKVRD